MSSVEPDSLTLFRPVGQQELELIQAGENKTFPPRLPEQPFFYPVLNEDYAIQIARDWNAIYNEPKCGYVTRFRVRKSFLDRYETKTVAVHFIRSIGYLPESLMNSTVTLLVKSK